MKLCFSTLGCHDKTLDEIIQLAKKYFIHAIEVRGINNEMSNDKILDFSDEHVQETIQKFKSNQIQPLILGTSCKFHHDATRANMIQKAKQEVMIAQKLGFKAIRVFGNLIEGNQKECIQKVATSINQICEFAKDKKIDVYLEVHGDFNTIERLQELIQQIQYPNFGLIWDVYHTHQPYGSNWYKFYQEMKPYIQHVHIKDTNQHQLVLPGEGEIDIIPIMKQLLEDGYQGYFSLEWERKWVPELCELEIALDTFLKLLQENQIN